MRTVRFWLALCCSLALVGALAARVVVAQISPDDPLESSVFADASGGSGGSARGADGGRGGSGTLTVCSQNTNDTYWAEDDPKLNCGAGGRGGDGGDAGESIGGFGGIAFAVGGPPTTTTTRPTGADAFVRQRTTNSFVVTVGNNGPLTAADVRLTLELTADGFAQLFSVSSTGGTCSPDPEEAVPFPVSVTCEFGAIAPGDAYEVTIEWGPPLLPTTATSRATVTTTTHDLQPANNTSVQTELIIPS